MGKLQACTECSSAAQKGIAAAKVGHLECLRAVYSSSSVLNERDQFGATPIHYAARQGHLECVKWLCESSGVSPNSAARNGATPAHDAAATGHVECLNYLLKETKCSANDRTNEGATVLQLTCRFGKAKVLKWLLSEEIVSLKDKGANDVTAVHIAAAKDNLSCLKVLTRSREYTANEVTKSGATPVYFAAQEGSLRSLRWLVERCNGDALQRASDGMAPVHAAAGSGHILCMQYLIENAGISSRMRSAEGATPAHYAAAAGKIQCLQWLLDKIKGKKLDKDLSGGTAIHDAAELGQADALRVFLRRGYKSDEKDDEGVTALDLARENNHKECVDLLLGVGNIGTDTKVDLSNPGAAIRKASASADHRDKRASIISMRSDDFQMDMQNEAVQAEARSPAVTSQDSVDGGAQASPDHRPLPPPPPRAAKASDEIQAEASKPDMQGAVTSDDAATDMASDGARVFSDTDDDELDDSNSRQRKKSIAGFFTQMKKRLSTSSLVDPSAKASEPPTPTDDGKDAERKRRRFKMPKLKKLWRSQTSLDKAATAASAAVSRSKSGKQRSRSRSTESVTQERQSTQSTQGTSPATVSSGRVSSRHSARAHRRRTFRQHSPSVPRSRHAIHGIGHAIGRTRGSASSAQHNNASGSSSPRSGNSRSPVRRSLSRVCDDKMPSASASTVTETATDCVKEHAISTPGQVLMLTMALSSDCQYLLSACQAALESDEEENGQEHAQLVQQWLLEVTLEHCRHMKEQLNAIAPGLVADTNAL
eukprot:scpid44360/ scgid3406/ Espin; Ectoplasmic specialization protein